MRKAKTSEGGERQDWARRVHQSTVLFPVFPQSSLVEVNCADIAESLSLWPELMLPAQRAQQLGAASAAATALLSWAAQ